MDRSTKERLTGAIVLVAVAWLVIPVFLDGPGEEAGTVRQSVDLPGQEGQPTRTRRIVLDPRPETARGGEGSAKITDPPPVTRKLPAATSDSGTGPAAEKRDDTPPTEAAGSPPAADPAPVTTADEDADPPASRPAEKPAPASDSGTAAADSLWAVQLGSFSNEENAEGLAADLRKQGFPAFLSRVQTGGRTLHRVRVGPQGSREEADKVAAALAKAGHRGQVVSHP